MVEVETDVERRNGVTFVRATVRNTRSTPQTVRLVNRLDGPTWQPRFGAVTAPEWQDDTWERTVKPGQTLGVGYASPADPSDPPLEAVSVSREEGEQTESTREVLASLDDWSPPNDALSLDR